MEDNSGHMRLKAHVEEQITKQFANNNGTKICVGC